MRFWGSVSLGMLLAMEGLAHARGAFPQSAAAKPGPRRKFNELTLAGLRPGRDKVSKALQLFGQPDERSADQQTLSWTFARKAGEFALHLDIDKAEMVQFVRVSLTDEQRKNAPRHSAFGARTWSSGRGLPVGAAASEVTRLYGEPDSRSPSTKGGQRLELLYYAFDWAGMDVPQVMEVVCSVAQDGKVARVVEITLAAPSL